MKTNRQLCVEKIANWQKALALTKKMGGDSTVPQDNVDYWLERYSFHKTAGSLDKEATVMT